MLSLNGQSLEIFYLFFHQTASSSPVRRVPRGFFCGVNHCTEIINFSSPILVVWITAQNQFPCKESLYRTINEKYKQNNFTAQNWFPCRESLCKNFLYFNTDFRAVNHCAEQYSAQWITAGNYRNLGISPGIVEKNWNCISIRIRAKCRLHYLQNLRPKNLVLLSL